MIGVRFGEEERYCGESSGRMECFVKWRSALMTESCDWMWAFEVAWLGQFLSLTPVYIWVLTC